MKRTAIITGLVAGTLSAGLVGAGTAGAATTAGSTKLDRQDTTFLRQNDQSDLAEITLGKYIEQHTASHRNAHKLAKRVVTDHTLVLSLVHKIAGGYDVTLPKLPNYTQRAAARQVKAASDTAKAYFEAEIAGHKTSIAQTEKEIKYGRNKTVVAFARRYLPVAKMHLAVAQHDLNWVDKH